MVEYIMIRSDNAYFHYIMSYNDNNRKAKHLFR